MEKKDTRSGFGAALTELGKENGNVVALCADVTGSVKMDGFMKAFPERFVQTGIAEANMIGMAAGMAITGKTPFVGGFATFVTGRVYDQIRMVVAYSNLNVKIAASHAGVTIGEDGATHQIMEDIGLMKMLPNMVVVNPCDYNQTFLATKAVAAHNGPAYLRYGRPVVPNFTSLDEPFVIGKAIKMAEGNDVSIFATGHLVWHALEAQKQLANEGISAEVINIHTIKPLDTEAILESVTKTKCVVTAEEHFKNGGLGDSICQLLAEKCPTPLEMVAVDNEFGQSGTPEELLHFYGLNAEGIVTAVKKVMARR